MKTGARSRVALLAVAAVTAVCGWYARGVTVESGLTDYLPDDVPEVKAWLDSLHRFDAFDAWMVGLEEPGAGLSIEGLRHVDLVTHKLQELKASGVLAVRSVTNVASLREGEDGSVESSPLVTALPTDPAALDALRGRIQGDREVLGALVSRDLKGYVIVVRADPRKDAAAVARLIERTVETGRGPLRAHYYGAPFFAAVPIEHLTARLPWLAPLCTLLLLGIFIAGTRRFWGALLVLGAAGASLVWGLALMRWLGKSLSPSSGNLALLLFAIAGAIFAGFLEGPSPSTLRFKRAPFTVRVMLCLATVAVGALLISQSQLLCTPQDMFSAHDEVGESLAFFDARFGGSDFLQVDFKGDLADPAVAARLLRLTDLLEGSGDLADVRSVAQILAFLNHGFGDAYRIPSSREGLANIWFFLEGNGDVRNLVTDKHDEAMIMVRVPSHPRQGIGALVGAVNAAVAKSVVPERAAAAERLQAIARASGLELETGRVAAVVDAAAHEPSRADDAAIGAQVAARLRTILASPDSPYQPSGEEWEKLEPILAGGPVELRNRLLPAAAAMDKLTAAGMDKKFVDMLVEREQNLWLNERSRLLATKLIDGWANAPEAFRERAAGAVADLIDPQREAGKADVVVGGLPVVAGAIGSSLKSHLWHALALILGLGFVVSLLRGVSGGFGGLLVASTATALTFVGCRAAGVEMDSGSATVYLLPALLGFVAWGAKRGSQVFLIALGAGIVPLLFTGALPVTRLAAVASMGLGSVVLAAWFLRPARRETRAASG